MSKKRMRLNVALLLLTLQISTMTVAAENEEVADPDETASIEDDTNISQSETTMTAAAEDNEVVDPVDESMSSEDDNNISEDETTFLESSNSTNDDNETEIVTDPPVPLNWARCLGSVPVLSMVLLHDESMVPNCAGSLVSQYWVLTVAHCLGPERTRWAKVGLMNEGVRKRHERTIEVAAFYQHEDYDPEDFLHDVGMVKLNERVARSDFVKYAALPKWTKKTEPPTCQSLVVTAWGNLKGWSPPPDYFVCAHVAVVNDCVQRFEHVFDSYYVICSEDPGGEVCPSISGGPAFCGRTVEGVVSWAKCCAIWNLYGYRPGLYVRVNQHLGFIYGVMNEVKPQSKIGESNGSHRWENALVWLCWVVVVVQVSS